MRVLITREADEGNEGCYHLAMDGSPNSLCGVIRGKQYFGGDLHEVLSREEAEQRGLRPCQTCIEIHEKEKRI